MKWFKKHFGRADYTADQEKFAALYLALKGPIEMVMLAGREKPLDDTVYIRIPEAMLVSFPDYQPSGPPEESRVSGVYGDQGELNRFIKVGR
jgi:hypothetical protein